MSQKKYKKNTGSSEGKSISGCQHLAPGSKECSCNCWEQDYSKNNVTGVQRQMLTVQ